MNSLIKKYAFLILFILLLAKNLFLAAQPSIQWQKSIGGSNAERSYSIINTLDGGYITCGSSLSNNGDFPTNNGTGTYDSWIVKMDSLGNIQWKKNYGGALNDGASCIIQTTDGGYAIAGYFAPSQFDTDFRVIKLDPSGTFQWQRTYGGSYGDGAASIVQTPDGGYLVAGEANSSNGNLTVNNGADDFWIIKLTSTGNLVWQKSLGGSSFDRAFSVAHTSDNGCIVSGYAQSHDFDVAGNHGAIFVPDFWVIKLDSSGSIQWKRCYGGSLVEEGVSVVQSNDGNYLVCGYTVSNDGDVFGNHGNQDAWLIKLDTLGNILWQKCYGGTSADFFYSLAQTSDGGYILAGHSWSNDGDVISNNGKSDFWVVKIDSIGTLEWQKSIGGSDEEEAYSIAPTPDGGYIVSGVTYSNDGDVSGGHGSQDFWIVKLSCRSPKASFSTSSISCIGDTILLTSISTFKDSVHWVHNGMKFSNNSNSFLVLNTIGIQNISLVAFGANCSNRNNPMKDTATKTITVKPLPTLNVSGFVNKYCINGSPTSLTGNPSGGIFTGNGMVGNTFDPISAGLGTSAISYQYVDTNGCSNTFTRQVTIYPLPNVNFTGLSPEFCINGSPTSLTGNPSGGTFTGNGMVGNTFDPISAGLGTSAISYQYVDTNGCSNTVNQIIKVIPLPTASIIGNNIICLGETETLTFEGVGSYLWSTGDTTKSIQISPNKDVTLSVVASNDCWADTAKILITVNPLPSTTISDNMTIPYGGTANLTATGGVTYAWSPVTKLSCINCPNPKANPDQTTTYTVTITDINGCSSSNEVIITTDCDDIFVPNFFSPNDDSQNDLECIYGYCIESMTFAIFDRWGEKVFETNNKQQCWDGKYKGKLLDEAVFAYYLKAILVTGAEISKTGNISLIR